MANSMANDVATESVFFKQLDDTGRKRYKQKLDQLGLNEDPYVMSAGFETDMSLWPPVEFPDICVYLLNSPSPCTLEELKAYKSTEAWSYFVAGFVDGVKVKKVDENVFLMIAKVKHSQAMSSPCLLPWVGINKSGRILCAHCNCMAGAGEACSHVAALLYAIMAGVMMQQQTSCTSLPCQWLAPSITKQVSYSTISEIHFSKPCTSLKRVISCTDSEVVLPSKEKRPKCRPCPLVDENEFYSKLKLANPKAAILSLVPPHSSDFLPSSLLSARLPPLLSDLYKPEYLQMPYHCLLNACVDVFKMLHVTEQQAMNLEKETRAQSKSKLWFRHRAGRVTASRFKSVLSTDLARPSQSLVKSICYPESYRFSGCATKWGCDHEKKAREEYVVRAKEQHENFVITDSGLVINPKFPHLGASPDGLIACDCCGLGCLEIKCPYCNKDSLPESANFIDDDSKLKKSHEYYYQVQMQIYLRKVKFCDFVVWTKKGIHVERIVAEQEEFFTDVIADVNEFYKFCLLPELIGKWYTRQSVMPEGPVNACSSSSQCTDATDTPNSYKYCYCKKFKVDETMIGCDFANCKNEWFHLTCLKLKNVPKGKWYCPDCRKLFKGRNPPKLITK